MQLPQNVPTEVWVEATLKAQEAALDRTKDLNPSASRVQLFWTIYNFEIWKEIERWLRNNA